MREEGREGVRERGVGKEKGKVREKEREGRRK